MKTTKELAEAVTTGAMTFEEALKELGWIDSKVFRIQLEKVLKEFEALIRICKG